MRFAVALLLAACGRVDFDPVPQADAMLADGLADALELGPFGAPQLVTEVNAIEYDDDPTLSADQLVMVLNSGRPGGSTNGDIWMASRASTAQPFATPGFVAELSTAFDDTGAELAADGLRIYLASNAASTTDRDIYTSSRGDRSSPWSPPVAVAELNTIANERSAIETDDGLMLFFDSDRAGTYDLYVATRATPAAPWTAISLVAELSRPDTTDGEHWVSGDGLVIVFSSDRAGGNGQALWQSRRVRRDEPFELPTLVSELDGAGLDTDPWLSPDLRTVYFTSERSGDGEIYVATR